jgi:protein-tyrosine phosphatase
MAPNRILTWEGCNNVRDLGGMHTSDGCKTRWGAVVRGDHPAKLTADGWSALYEHGIRTIISLRTHGFNEKDYLEVKPPYQDIETMVIEIEDVTDQEFVEKWASSELWCTPLYYSDALAHWPQRHATALQAIAQAKPGGVLFHCKRGYDRTGIIAMLLLTLVGVSTEDIIADYELSRDTERDEILANYQTTSRAVIVNTLTGINVDDYLLSGGLSRADIHAIRKRFIEQAGNNV